MNLCASLIVRNELGRYLEPCVEHLLAFCDEIRVVTDNCSDGTWEYLHEIDRVALKPNMGPAFFEHEGRARQGLIEWTLESEPTHVVSIDCDEFVADGSGLRARLEADPDVPVWSLDVTEVWGVDRKRIYSREDGGWRTHPLSCVWRVDPKVTYRMLDRKLACRRVPSQVLTQRPRDSGVSLLHWGWADKATRQQRYDRYAKHDGGRFHASAHLRSILWDDRRVRLDEHPWPEGAVFETLRERFAVAA